MLRNLFFLALLVAGASARRAPAPSTAPSFWAIQSADAEVFAEAATGAPEPETMMMKSKTAAAPAPSKRRRESASSFDKDTADAEVEAFTAFAQIAAGAQEIEAMTADEDAGDVSAPLGLPTFLELHGEQDAAPEMAVSDDAIFLAADSAASAADAAVAGGSAFGQPTADLEAALEAAAETGSAVVVVDDATVEVVPLAGEEFS